MEPIIGPLRQRLLILAVLPAHAEARLIRVAGFRQAIGDRRPKLRIGVPLTILATDGAIADQAARPRWPLAFVAGEIDVRCHIVRQQYEEGRLPDEIVETLSARYVGRLAAMARSFPGSPIIVFGVTPPFHAPGYGADQLPIFGSLPERVVASRRLNAALARRALVDGLHYFDAYDALAGADGTLPFDRSDHFGHIGHDWKHVVTDRLYRLLNDVSGAR